LQQVLLNLIMNSVEAMRGVTERNRELAVSSTVEQGSVLVSVKDTGAGLDPSAAERMFQPFFTTKPDGLGMTRHLPVNRRSAWRTLVGIAPHAAWRRRPLYCSVMGGALAPHRSCGSARS
jgi:hypothetical protein